jgi:alpha-N-arabinofuranosidase
VDNCLGNLAVKSAGSDRISVDELKPVRQLQPSFFGFNLEWLEFQSMLWDKQHGVVKPDALEVLRAFPGAVYRYPGGTDSNYYDWHDATGATGTRAVKKRSSWAAPLAIQFGLSEYLKFVRDVGGQAWYVANMYGKVGQELSADDMSKAAGELSAYLRQQREAGSPAVLRWELGNELDRDVYHWPPQKLADVSVAVSKEIKAHDSAAHVVGMLEEYAAMDKAGFTASNYNKTMAGALAPMTDEFAMHLYYDGKPGGPPVKNQLNALCRAVDNARTAGVQNPTIWITEQARVPEGAFTTPDWKALWPETANLQAALGVADMLIGAAQMPEVNGTMIHALHASDGPWPMFHHSPSGDHVYPSVVMLALRMLRESMLPEVLRTKSESQNASGYDGGYDMRAVVMTDTDHKHYAIWAVNRDAQTADVALNIPGLKGTALSGKQVTLSDPNVKANNYTDNQHVHPQESAAKINFDTNGASTLKMPPHSIVVLTLSAS